MLNHAQFSRLAPCQPQNPIFWRTVYLPTLTMQINHSWIGWHTLETGDPSWVHALIWSNGQPGRLGRHTLVEKHPAAMLWKLGGGSWVNLSKNNFYMLCYINPRFPNTFHVRRCHLEPTNIPSKHQTSREVFARKTRATHLESKLGGGFKDFLFSPLPGEMIQFD